MRRDRSRQERVIRALERRISTHGDMHIRVHRNTMRVVLEAAGIGGWEVGEDTWREIDALALDALRHVAWFNWLWRVM